MPSKINLAALLGLFFLFFVADAHAFQKVAAPKFEALADSFSRVQLIPYRAKNAKWGLSTLAHDIVVPCIYDEIKIETAAPNIYLIRQNNAWYAYNYEGKLLIDKGYKSIDIQANLAVLMSHKKGKNIVQNIINNRVIVKGYDNYTIKGQWIIAQGGKINGVHIFDTTGRQVSKEKYKYAQALRYNQNYYIGCRDSAECALISPTKGRISDFAFEYIADANDYFVATRKDVYYTYYDLKGNKLNNPDRVNIYSHYYNSDSLLFDIDEDVWNYDDSIFYSHAISHIGNKYSLMYKQHNLEHISDINKIFVSIDSGKTYQSANIRYNAFTTLSTKISAAELKNIYLSPLLLSDIYVVKQNNKLGIWSAKSKKILVEANYTNVNLLDGDFNSYFSNVSKSREGYTTNIILSNDKETILFNPNTKTYKILKSLPLPQLDTSIFAENYQIKYLFDDIITIEPRYSNTMYIYDIKLDKILYQTNQYFIFLANWEERLIWLKPDTTNIILAQVGQNDINIIDTIYNDAPIYRISNAWLRGVYIEDATFSDAGYWYDFNSKRIDILNKHPMQIYPQGYIINYKAIYNLKLEQLNYKAKGKLKQKFNIIADVYEVETKEGKTTECLYIDWTGKAYAEE